MTMSDRDKDSLEKRLRHWNLELNEDPMLAHHVLNQISSGEGNRTPPHPAGFPVHWLLVLATAAALLLGVFFTSQQIERVRSQREGGYYSMIDPVFRLQVSTGEGIDASNRLLEDSLIDRLAWMQNRLGLTEPQFIELVELHKGYEDRFNGLFEELVHLESQYGEFEELRIRNEMVDFIALYNILLERRNVRESSHILSREFVEKAIAILTTDQRQPYLSLVQKSLGPADD